MTATTTSTNKETTEATDTSNDTDINIPDGIKTRIPEVATIMEDGEGRYIMIDDLGISRVLEELPPPPTTVTIEEI